MNNNISESNSGKSIRLMLPDESLVVADMRIDGNPFVGVINVGLKEFHHKDVFGWYLSIIIDYDNLIGDGMPEEEDTAKMQTFSDTLTDRLSGNPIHPNAIFLGRVTGNGYSEIMWYVNNPDIADLLIRNLIDSKEYPFEFDYEMTYDPEWNEADYWLKNL